MVQTDFDVAVVGYGPTGLTAASLLGQLGHRVVVIERWPTLYGMPRLTHIDGETARLLSFVCDIREALRDCSPINSFIFYNAKGRRLTDVAEIASLQMGFPAHISIHQPDIEAAIDRRVRTLSNVSVYQGTELTGLNASRQSDRASGERPAIGTRRCARVMCSAPTVPAVSSARRSGSSATTAASTNDG